MKFMVSMFKFGIAMAIAVCIFILAFAIRY